MQTICASGVDGALYSVQRIVIPEPVAEGSEAEALESEQRTFLEEEGRRLVAEEAIDLGGQPGRAFEFVGPPPSGGEGEVTSRSRIYLVDRDVFYVLSVMSALGEPLPGGADRFLGSLAIEPPAARAAAEQRDAEETLRLFLAAAARHDEGRSGPSRCRTRISPGYWPARRPPPRPRPHSGPCRSGPSSPGTWSRSRPRTARGR